MERVLRSAWWVTVVGLLAVAAGLVMVFAQALSEVLADPGLSLADGYWIGRLPLMAVGVDLTVIGATVVAVFGTVTAWLAGGPIRRIVSTIALAVVAFWWFAAMLLFPYDRGTCVPACPPHGPDPIAVAYSAPAVAAQFLLLPAVIVGCVAIGVRRNRRGADPGAPAA